MLLLLLLLFVVFGAILYVKIWVAALCFFLTLMVCAFFKGVGEAVKEQQANQPPPKRPHIPYGP